MKFTLFKSKSKGLMEWVYKPLKNFINSSGQLSDFRTKKLEFSLKNPVTISAQESYDRSVNLIINDGNSYPKLINTRFSSTGMNTFEVRERRNQDDTNLYYDNKLKQQTSLFKKNLVITQVSFLDESLNGSLKVGNYVFYFKLEDSDGNLSDIIAESGVVSIFKGSGSQANGGFRDENSGKSITLKLSNIDTSYNYVRVFYTRSSSDLNQNSNTQAMEIVTKYPIKADKADMNISINGEAEERQITLSELNLDYFIASSVQAQAICSNMLFLGNVKKNLINEQDLADISLRFVPRVYKQISNYNDYNRGSSLYSYTGYQLNEYYRFGIVYILDTGELTPVFNVLGGIINEDSLTQVDPLYDNDTRRKLLFEHDEDSKNINNATVNKWGVCKITAGNIDERNTVLGIQFQPQNKDEIIKALSQYNIKGYFFVRQKRLPLRICQAVTVEIEPLSFTPTPKIGTTNTNIVEGFLNEDRELTHGKQAHTLNVSAITPSNAPYGGKAYCAAFCPDYDVNYPVLNSLFQGDSYKVQQVTNGSGFDFLGSKLLQVSDRDTLTGSKSFKDVKIVGLEDNTKLVSINEGMQEMKFAARAGEPEEGFRYAKVQMNGQGENNKKENRNYIRGSFGPFIGLSKYYEPGSVINIYLNEVTSSHENLCKKRWEDRSAYFAISNRYPLNELTDDPFTCYRGDSYICDFTHRINRNFNDPAAPTNDVIVDANCWKDHFDVKNGQVVYEQFKKINLGDINAVKLGYWVNMTVVSNINLNLRCTDASHPDEYSLHSKPRTFHPYTQIDDSGLNKMPEALCYNKGHQKTLSERYNYEHSNSPAIKKEFTTRICYSELGVTDFFKNGLRVFRGTKFRDYPKEYGSIIKLLNLKENLVVIFEHGVGVLQVNERILTGQGLNSQVFLTTNNVIPEQITMISQNHGSQWENSVIATDKAIYGVDSTTKKIWAIDGGSFKIISDTKIASFLNNHILADRYKLNISEMNIHTHYNPYKQDVIFSFYDESHKAYWSICYNEIMNNWVTFYSWMPLTSFSLYNTWFTFDQQKAYSIFKGTSKINNSLDIWKHGMLGPLKLSDRVNYNNLPEGIEDDSWAIRRVNSKDLEIKPCHWYGKQHPFEIEFVINANPESHKIFDTLKILSNNAEPESFHYQISGDAYSFAKDKVNMFVRQEATRHFYNMNQNDEKIYYDQYYYRFKPEHRLIQGSTNYDRSTIFPLTYIDRQKSIDNIMDNYYTKDGSPSHRFTELSGTEVVRDPQTNELCLWTHVKGANLLTEGRMWGNMHYKEDHWFVQISPILLKEVNEGSWPKDKDNNPIIPIAPHQQMYNNDTFKAKTEYTLPDGHQITTAFNNEPLREAKIKDKYLKVRIRYKGDKLTIIKGIISLYSISYS